MNTTHSLSGRRRGGFTMIELTITLLIFGILVALAAPAMSGYISQTRVDQAMNGLTSDLAYARMVAVRRSQPVTVTVSATQYTIDVANPPSTTPLRVKNVNVNSEYPGLTLSPALTITFDSRGLVRSGVDPANGTPVTATRSTQQASLTILPTGRTYRAY
ncbi:MAG: GspH/FimT family pseudopilin [Gemmatimonadetes bacterium]|nr:GspH/FimT family pseudopilin [Gemmatimonadota bacterium]